MISAFTSLLQREAAIATRLFVRNAILLGIAGLFLVLALVMGMVAIYHSLTTIWQPYWAAAAMAGGLFGLSLLVLAIRPLHRRRFLLWRRVPADAPPAATAQPASDPALIAAALRSDTNVLSRTAVTGAEKIYRRNPVGILAGAAVVGILAGMFLNSGDD